MRKMAIPAGQWLAARSSTLKVGFRHPGRDDASAKRRRCETLAVGVAVADVRLRRLGSRTRRGFGGLAITAPSGTAAGPWDAGVADSPRLTTTSSYVPLAGADRCVCRPIIAAPRRPRHATSPPATWPGGRPSYPVLEPEYHAPAVRPAATEHDWTRDLDRPGEHPRLPGRPRPTPGRPYRPQIKTAEWAERDPAWRRPFPLGALGLPVVYKRTAPPSTPITKAAGRIPCAVPPRCGCGAVGSAATAGGCCSFAFQAEFLPEASNAGRVTSGRQEQPRHRDAVTDDDVVERTEQLDQRDGRGRLIRNEPVRRHAPASRRVLTRG